jgi:phosphoribosylanthranilate isomerase
MTHVKICGITTVEDAEMCIELGADALGLNFVPSSSRLVPWTEAQAIASLVGNRCLLVGVVANLPIPEMEQLRSSIPLGCLQLHGDESPEQVQHLLPHAYKAVRLQGEHDVQRAQQFPGEYLLVDAYHPHALGGTGQVFNWQWVEELASQKKLTLAGGLTPRNVGQAIEQVRPFCVDVASGVEQSGFPRQKDRQKVRDFIQEVRRVSSKPQR